MKICAVCSKEGKSRCSRCKREWYCGIECQRRHYREHRKHCVSADPAPGSADLSLSSFSIIESRCTRCHCKAPYANVWERYRPCCDARLCSECDTRGAEMLEKNVLELDHTNEKELREKNPNTPCPFCGEIVADELAKIEDRVKLNPTSDVQALYVLGYTRIYGCKNSCRRPIEGCSLLEKATRFGNYEALYELGVATRDGNSGKADAAKAARMFRVAAAQGGNAKALYELGLAYLQGHGVDKDTTEAARLLDLGARENYDPCKKALANLFIDGNDLAQDRVKAAQLLGLHQTAEILKKGIEPPSFLFKQEAAVNVNDDSSTVPPSCEYTEAEMDEFFAEEDAD